MNTPLKEAQPCPNCGRPQPGGALAGLCPACLLAQGAETDGGEAAGTQRFKPPPLEEIAKLFPQLELIGLLGAGGMGAVYQARQSALDRMVALKVLPSTGERRANFEERFNREARALARLNHPNIVAVYEFGQAAGLHFFIMEFVQGANLRQLQRAGRLAPREALQIIPQICDALQYAHDEGVVHRDIKPENVLIDRRGRVKIADFGLAKIVGSDSESLRLTAEGQVMGTPHYMAPEQVERPLTVDHRADIYSLGVVFYEMLTGDLPLGKFSPPSRKVQLDVRLDEVVLRSLENDPERRYQQASEVKSRVETIADSSGPASTIPSPTPDPDQKLRHWQGFPMVTERDGGRRLNWKGTLLALAVVFGLLSVGFGLVSTISGRSIGGWLGVVGWQSVVARFLITLVLIGWGVRRAWNLPIARNGTVILSGRRAWWRNRRLIMPTILLYLAAWVTFREPWMASRIRDFFQLSTLNVLKVATRDTASGSLIGTLPGRGSVELLGLSDALGNSNLWWRPDGSLAAGALLEVNGLADMVAKNVQKKHLAFKVIGLPIDSDSPLCDFQPSASISMGGTVLDGGKPIPGGLPMRVAWPMAAQVATLRLGFGLAPWRTISTFDRRIPSTRFMNQPGDPKWLTSFNHIADDGIDTHVTMVLGPRDKNWKMRVIAVDMDEREITHRGASGTPLETSATWTLTFPAVTMERIKEIRVQVQPLQWLEFRDVPLKPTETTSDRPAAAVPHLLIPRESRRSFALNVGEASIELAAD